MSGDSIADVAGNPITTKAFNHWIYVAAKGQASQSPGSPVIIPDAPDFKKCVATLQKHLQSADALAEVRKHVGELTDRFPLYEWRREPAAALMR